jgi:hypothetical protein
MIFEKAWMVIENPRYILKCTIAWGVAQQSFIAGVVDTGDYPLHQNIFANLRKKFEMVLIGYSESWGKLICEKTRS